MRLRFLSAAVLGLLVAAPQSAEIDKALKTIKAADIQRHQVYLASDELEGREAGTEGGHKAALHISAHLASLGFEGGGGDGSYFYPFGGGGAMGELADANTLKIFKDPQRKASDDFKMGDALAPHARSRPGTVSGPVVVAGFGITATEYAYDDWKASGVKGAIVLVLDGEPQEADANSKFDGAKPTKYSETEHKIQMAEKAGAAAVLIAGREGSPKKTEFTWPPDGKAEAFKIPVALVSPELADKLAGKPLKTLRADIDGDLKPRSYKGSPLVELSISPRALPGKGKKNVLGIWRGRDSKLKDQWIVLGAHYDHVGRGRGGGGMGKKGEVHNGADDNASGTSTLLEVAEAIKETKPRRSILIMWFDEEEGGLIGSKNWCSNPTIPMDQIVAMINVDMVGRNATTKLDAGLEKEGKTFKYPKFAAVLADAERKFGLKFDWDGADEYVQRSDQWNFMEKGVPAVFFFGGMHADYHRDTDDVEKINFAKEELVGKIICWIALRIAMSEQSLR